jgi:UDP-glucose 4-epimerase
VKVLVTGSSGHLGEALMRLLPTLGHDPVGLDLTAGPFTSYLGSITDRIVVDRALAGVEAVLHTATLHKPHVVTHPKRAFTENNIGGTLTLLEAAAQTGLRRFVFTSTTSAFGAALSPEPGFPAAWIDEAVVPVPKNIYGVTKVAAEDLCALFSRLHGLNCVVLRTSRFFPEADDDEAIRSAFTDTNAKANEFLFRRVDIQDAAMAHVQAMLKAPDIKFGRYIISATTPFDRSDLAGLREDPSAVVASHYSDFRQIYDDAKFAMFPEIDRVYCNASARRELGWEPVHDFGSVLGQIARGEPIGSALGQLVRIKGYHGAVFPDGLYPTG